MCFQKRNKYDEYDFWGDKNPEMPTLMTAEKLAALGPISEQTMAAKAKDLIKTWIGKDIWDKVKSKGGSLRKLERPYDVSHHNNRIRMAPAVQQVVVDLSAEIYSNDAFPEIIAGHGVSTQARIDYIAQNKEKLEKAHRRNKKTGRPLRRSVTILTRFDRCMLKTRLHAELVAAHNEIGTGNKGKRGRHIYGNFITQEMVDRIDRTIHDSVPLQDKIYEVHADVCLVSGSTWYIIEFKTGGNTDSGKTPDVLENEMIRPFVCLGQRQKKIFLGVIDNSLGFNKDGLWNGPMGLILHPDMILVEQKLWDLLIPGPYTHKMFMDNDLLPYVDSLRPPLLTQKQRQFILRDCSYDDLPDFMKPLFDSITIENSR